MGAIYVICDGDTAYIDAAQMDGSQKDGAFTSEGPRKNGYQWVRELTCMGLWDVGVAPYLDGAYVGVVPYLDGAYEVCDLTWMGLIWMWGQELELNWCRKNGAYVCVGPRKKWAYVGVEPMQEWGLCGCGTYARVGLMQVWDLCKSGDYVGVGPMQEWGLCGYGTLHGLGMHAHIKWCIIHN